MASFTFNGSAAGIADATNGTLTNFSGGSIVDLQDAVGDAFGGGAFDDTIIAGAGDDTIHGGAGRDSINGGGGFDVFLVLEGEPVDDIDGGSGGNALDLRDISSRGAVINLASGLWNLSDDVGGMAPIFEVGLILGTQTSDFVIGNVLEDSLWGDAGNDTFAGAAGADFLNGEFGDDSLMGGNDDDTLIGGAGGDSLRGDDGNDQIGGGDDNDLLVGDSLAYDGLVFGAGVIARTPNLNNSSQVGALDVSNLWSLAADNAVGAAVDIPHVSVNSPVDSGGITHFYKVSAIAGQTLFADFDSPEELAFAALRLYDPSGRMVAFAGNSDAAVGGLGSTQLYHPYLIYTAVESGFYTVEAGLREPGTSNFLGNLPLNPFAINDTYTLQLSLTGYSGLGNDSLSGDAGADILVGGPGNDTLFGGSGVDVLSGGWGDDVFLYNNTNSNAADVLEGGPGVDQLHVNSSRVGPMLMITSIEEIYVGNFSIVRFYADQFNEAGVSPEVRIVSDGFDFGNNGDRVEVEMLNSTVFSAAGFSFVDWGPTSRIHIIGDDDAESITGSIQADSISAARGNDSLNGGEGADTLNGGDGNDILNGGSGNDTLIGGAQDDTLEGGGGNDVADYSGAAGPVTAELWRAQVVNDGHGAVDTLIGIEALYGSAFGDTLVGDNNDNTLRGGAGNDGLYGGTGSDTIDYSSAAVGIKVDLAAGYANDGQGGTDFLIDIENINGSRLNDYLNGSSAANRFRGGAGNDTFVGGAGIDTVEFGDAVLPVAVDLAASYAYDFQGGLDYLVGIENVAGSRFSDYLSGDRGANLFSGLEGDDSLVGGAGYDVAVYSGLSAGYRFSRINNNIVVTDINTGDGDDGVDTLVDIETAMFQDGAISLTGEFRVNTTTLPDQEQPAIAVLADGSFVIAWDSWPSGGSYAQRFDANAVPLGNEMPTGFLSYPSIAGLEAGGFVVAGHGFASDGDRNGVYARRYDANGQEQGSGFGVNTAIAGDQWYAAVAALEGGGFVIAWQSYQQGGILYDIYAQRYDADGSAVGGELLVNATTANDEQYVSISGLSDGGFVATWTSINLDGSLNGIFGQRYDNSGVAQGGEFRVGVSGSDQFGAVIAGLADGGFVVAWTSNGNFYTPGGVYAQRFSANGVALGDAFHVYPAELQVAYGAAITALSGGGFLITWTTDGDVHAQRYSANGLTQGGEFRVNATTESSQFNAVATALPDGGFVVTWTSTFQDGSGQGVYAQRYDANGNAVQMHLTGDGAGNAIRWSGTTAVILDGGSGNDTLTGNAGNDTLDGGAGDDIIDGAGGLDTASYAAAVGAVSINLLVAGGQNTINAGTDVLVGIENLIGSGYGDILTGDDFNNALIGTSGDDTFTGGAGNDTLDGGRDMDTVSYVASGGMVNANLENGTASDGLGGSDVLRDIENLLGGSGPDNLTGNDQANQLSGGAGNDSLVGSAGNDTLQGGEGDDTLTGGPGMDTATYASSSGAVTVNLAAFGLQNTVNAGNDTLTDIEYLTGSSFSDSLAGNSEDNRLSGGTGNDTLLGAGGNDFLDGEGDVDTVSFATSAGAVNASLQTGAASDGLGGTDLLFRIENVLGSSYDDVLFGDSGSNQLSGGLGNDTLDGGTGDDEMDGGEGTDTASYFSGFGVTVTLATAGATNTGYAGNDTLIDIENLVGSSFNDALTGNGGNNILNGESGQDTLAGGAGNDTLVGGSETDMANYAESAGPVNASLATGEVSDGSGGTDTLIAIENLTGSRFGDTLVGDAGDNLLFGNDGNDRLIGGSGFDTLDGGAGSDSADYSDAPDGVTIELLQSLTLDDGQGAADTLIRIENLIGSAFGDIFTGDNNNNRFRGGAGADSLYGSTGIDTADYSTAAMGVTVDLVARYAHDGQGGIDYVSEIENLIGSPFDDFLSGDSGDNYFEGGAGSDIFVGLAGSDTVDLSGASTAAAVDLLGQYAIDGLGGVDYLVGIENIIGTAFVDYLRGSASDNAFTGGSGSDIVIGLGGSDTADYSRSTSGTAIDLTAQYGIDGLGGTDMLVDIENIIGSGFNDYLSGSASDNRFRGGAGDDILVGMQGNDTADYSSGITGVTVNLTEQFALDGLGGTDFLVGIENLIGSAFDDYLTGSSGDNRFEAGAGSDSISGGEGIDVADYARAANAVRVNLAAFYANDGQVDLDILFGIENVDGSLFDDTLFGNGGVNILAGNAGSDVLRGNAGNDTLDGGAGSDTVDYSVSAAGVTAELWRLFVVDDGSGGSDALVSIENISGSSFNDILAGDGNDNLFRGGGGFDQFYGGSGVDTVDYREATSAVTVNLSSAGTSDDGQGASDFLNSIENLIGSAFGDSLIGDANGNTLSGAAGNDFMMGAGGADGFVFNSGDGRDVITDFSLADGDKLFLQSNLNGSGITSGTQALAHTFDAGGNAIIDLGGGNSVALLGVSTANLTAGDFIVF